MTYFFSYLLALTLTASSYFFGSRVLSHGIAIWQAILIGFSVVSIGALTETLGAPIWLVVLLPFPIGMLLLYLFLNVSPLIWFFSYLLILLLYTLIHIIMSYFFHFHSLIPAWRLS